MDMSFSGLLTAISTEFKSGKHAIPDLCYSLQETGYAMLVRSLRGLSPIQRNLNSS